MGKGGLEGLGVGGNRIEILKKKIFFGRGWGGGMVGQDRNEVRTKYCNLRLEENFKQIFFLSI